MAINSELLKKLLVVEQSSDPANEKSDSVEKSCLLQHPTKTETEQGYSLPPLETLKPVCFKPKI